MFGALGVGGLWGLKNSEYGRGLYSLKAAIESSIESNCCAISVDEGILGNRLSAELFVPLTAQLGC